MLPEFVIAASSIFPDGVKLSPQDAQATWFFIKLLGACLTGSGLYIWYQGRLLDKGCQRPCCKKPDSSSYTPPKNARGSTVFCPLHRVPRGECEDQHT